MDRKGLCQVQERTEAFNGAELVCIHGVQDEEARGICPRLDKLLRDIRVLSTDPGIGSLAEEADQDVLLETVAQMPHAGSKSCQTGMPVRRCNFSRNEPERTVASCENICHTVGNE